MINLILADLYKISKSLAIKILFVITTVSAVVMASIAYMIPQGKMDASMTGIGFLFSDTNMITILGAVIAGILICGDFENKTIHDAITNGNSRIAVIISKSITFFFAVFLILLPYVIVTGIAIGTGSDFSMGSVAIGFLHLMTSSAGTALSGAEIWKLLLVVLSLIVVTLAQLSICVPLAFTLKKPIFVIALNYGISILSAQLMGLRERSSVFDFVLDCTPYGGNYSFLTLESGAGDLLKAISVSLIYIVIMIAISYRVFRKSEIK